MRQPALIFDFGNVVAHFDYGRAAARLGAHAGLSGEDVLARLPGFGFPDLLKQYESGKTPAEQFGRAVGAGLGIEIGHDEFAAAWADIFDLNPSVADLIAELKAKGYRLILGSNTNDLHAAHFRHQFDATLAHFDHLILSYEVGHNKPAAEFYRACVAAAGLPADRCVFIDDLPENVEGARACGLRGILYRETPALRAELVSIGVEVGANPDAGSCEIGGRSAN